MPAGLGFEDTNISFIPYLFTVISGSLSPAWSVFRLRVEERSPVWRVPGNIMNKQSRTAVKRWSSSLVVGRGANNSPP